jgi:DNA-directed RNA polymerase specialized sigma24 family protein
MRRTTPIPAEVELTSALPAPWRRPAREVAVGGPLLSDIVDGKRIHPRTLFRLNAGVDYRRPTLADPTPAPLADPYDETSLEAFDAESVPFADPLDVLIAREEARDRAALRWKVRQLLRKLDPVEREVVRLRYGFGGREPLGPAAIAAELGMCRKTAYNVHERAMAKLRGDDQASQMLADIVNSAAA